MVRFTIFVCFFAVAHVSAKVKLGKYSFFFNAKWKLILFVTVDSMIPLCSKSDPNLNECVKKSGNALLPFLTKGIRDFGFPPVDPLKIPFLALSQNDGPVGLKLNISDTTHEGTRMAKIVAAK